MKNTSQTKESIINETKKLSENFNPTHKQKGLTEFIELSRVSAANINIDYKDSIQEGMSSVKDFFGKAYEGTKNAINKMDLGNKLNSAKNVIHDAGKSILENKQINSFINFFWKGKEENENKENNGTENEKGKNNDIDDN